MTTAPLFAGIGGHHQRRPRTEEWLTPPWLIEALGGWRSFALDPCAPAVQPWPTARRVYTRADDGLARPWDGRVWMNPPYSSSSMGRWLGRMAEHGAGVALIFARTETVPFFRFVWEAASALLFLRGRLNFHLPDGRMAAKNSGAPSVLVAYGAKDADVLAAAALDGQFVPLQLRRSVLVAALDLGSIEDGTTPSPLQQPTHAADGSTWRQLVAAWLAERAGPVRLADLYRAFASHPKAVGNRNVDAKIRQVLQRGPFRRVAPGLWENCRGR